MSCFNPEVTVHDCKLRVDGISKYLDSVGFRFDHTFGDEDSTDLVSSDFVFVSPKFGASEDGFLLCFFSLCKNWVVAVNSSNDTPLLTLR